MVSLKFVAAYVLPIAAVLSSASADSSEDEWEYCDEITTTIGSMTSTGSVSSASVVPTTSPSSVVPTTTAAASTDSTSTSSSAASTSTSAPFSGSGYLEGYYSGTQKGCMITAGTWYAGTCAKITAIPLDTGFTISTSKCPCAVIDTVIHCAAGTTPSVFDEIDGLLAYGGSSAFYAPAVPNPAQTVSQTEDAVAVTFKWLQL